MRIVSYAAALALLTATAACGDNGNAPDTGQGPATGTFSNSPQTYQSQPTTGNGIGPSVQAPTEQRPLNNNSSY